MNQYFANKDQDNNQMLIDIDKNLTIFESGDEIVLFIHVDHCLLSHDHDGEYAASHAQSGHYDSLPPG